LFFDNSDRFTVTELQKAAVAPMDATIVQWGLTISITKTKVLVVGRDTVEQLLSLPSGGKVLEVVTPFKYLGSMFTSDSMLNKEIAHRVADVSYSGSIKLKSGCQMLCPCPPNSSLSRPLS